ncbi:MAG: SDR family oxidoreductase [Bdellovibrionaceae bacterium]|nr:SDR family oxidoreductase [Pseudobdellovibrionaceae bacterium]
MELNKNKIVLITGASRGIGKAFALAIAKKGCHVQITLRKHDDSLEKELTAAGAASVKTYVVDFATKQGVDDFCKTVVAENQKIDVVINNAGLLTGGLLETQDINDIYAMMQVNLLAVTQLCHFFIPRMIAQGGGKLVNNASVSGRMFLPCANTYAAAKAGVVALSESLMGELAGTPVTVLLLITPGVKTEMFDDIYNQYSKNMDLSFLSSIPAEEWASKVIHGIETDATHVMPSGSTRFGVWLGQHMPGTLRKLMSSKFNR